MHHPASAFPHALLCVPAIHSLTRCTHGSLLACTRSTCGPASSDCGWSTGKLRETDSPPNENRVHCGGEEVRLWMSTSRHMSRLSHCTSPCTCGSTWTRTKRRQCQYCSYTCRDLTRMVTHECGHVEDRTFRCRFCTWSAFSLSIITTHERLHSADRVFRCRFCSFTTARAEMYVTECACTVTALPCVSNQRLVFRIFMPPQH